MQILEFCSGSLFWDIWIEQEEVAVGVHFDARSESVFGHVCVCTHARTRWNYQIDEILIFETNSAGKPDVGMVDASTNFSNL